MNQRTTGLTAVFTILLVLTLGGIVYHQLSGYPYPASPASTYELNVIGDLYEAFILVPIGLIGLLVLRTGSSWGPTLMGGVAATLTYNYAMAVTGQQNLWIFFWTAKFALAGLSLILVWAALPIGSKKPSRVRLAMAAYIGVITLLIGTLMARRLAASAAGLAMEMTMQVRGPVDWAEPFVRDPIIFLAFVVPLAVTAFLGLLRGAQWGARAASLSNTFVVNMVIMILMTGPIKELLQTGALSAGMLPISIVFIAIALPGVWGLIWVTKEDPRLTR